MKKSNLFFTSPRRILGVDPGLAATGWGLVEYESNRLIHVAHGCIETDPRLSRPERLLYIYRHVRDIIASYTPGEGAVETLYMGKNTATAIPVAEARGVVCMAMAERGLIVREYTPLVIKQAIVGRGKAEKHQVQEMVRFLLGLDTVPQPDHAADALAAAICLAHDTACVALRS
ncbi:MAG: crossover junction endodeoxyribonuclease RuvC [Treponemataceae bacterium]|nr:crossover junction endodeoxyribonuclease RuvC [Treponemataceae bacterium]